MPDEKPELDKPVAEKVAATTSAETSPAIPAAPTAAKPSPAAAKPAPPPPPPKPTPKAWECDLVASLKRQYGSGIREASVYLKDQYLVVDKGIVFEILKRMKEEEGFDYCVDVTAVHWPKREEQFDVVYILYSFAKNERVRVETTIKDGEKVRSAYSLWPTADWLVLLVFVL